MSTKKHTKVGHEPYIGQKLGEIKMTFDLTNEEIGNVIGVSGEQIRKYLKGPGGPRKPARDALCRAYSVTETWLLGKADSGGPSDKQDHEAMRLFEELINSNDDEILNHLRRQLPLLKELMERRKKETKS